MSKRSEPADGHPELKHPDPKRAKEVDAKPPFDELKHALESQNKDSKPTKVLHWFRSKDLRIQDNKALDAASQKASEAGVPLLTCYLNCPAEFDWHGTSPARIDFIFETLKIMQGELKKLGIPLVVLEAGSREEIDPTVLKFVEENGISHVFANFEYEVDELRRDIKFVKEGGKAGFNFHLEHDQTVVEPGTMTTGGGKAMKVFTPFHHKWVELISSEPSLLDTVGPPEKNNDKAQKELSSLFDSKIPAPPKSHAFKSDEERKRLRKLWPAGHEAGIKRMKGFIERIDDYKATRSNPAADTSSRMSPYFAAGVVSVREALALVRDHNNGSTDFSTGGSSSGVYSWVREVVFRELYRQTTVTTPHTVMNLPQNLKFDFVHWEEDEEGYKKWEEGTTGFPFIDAGMRQLKHEAWMHNRLRMNVSSFLSRSQLIDYRRGERYFVETLIDWDLNNNTQGWEPSYTVFNPILQAEKNDPDGEYIRRWVPELKDVKGKAVFMPYERLSKEEFKKLGYPEPCLDLKESRNRAIERFKGDMAEADI